MNKLVIMFNGTAHTFPLNTPAVRTASTDSSSPGLAALARLRVRELTVPYVRSAGEVIRLVEALIEAETPEQVTAALDAARLIEP